MRNSVSAARRGHRRTRLALPAVIGTAALLCSTAVGAVPAEAAPAAARGQGTATDAAGSSGQDGTTDHAMGSQIRLHEGASSASGKQAATQSGTSQPTSSPSVSSQAVTPQSASLKAVTPLAASSGVEGLDVSHWNGTVDWAAHAKAGRQFTWIKATEGTGYTSPTFNAQYTGSAKAGLLRGAYHFALPNVSSGAAQATYFSAHGGGWSGDGKTLPGVVDLEYNPYSGGDCYGMSKAALTAWIKDFSTTYHARWGKYPVIYTSASWWNTCVGSTAFASTSPLWLARYASTPGTLPTGWAYQSVWQYSTSGFDHDRFNGSASALKKLAVTKD